MNDLNLTVTGWVATDPNRVMTRDGSGPPMVTFRLAQTPRYFDRNAAKWKDSQTEWFTVRVFRDAAITVGDSISKGQPVVVAGRLRTNEWVDSQDQARVDLQLDATAVGHDLTRGTAKFTRVTVTDGEEGASSEEDPGVDDIEADAADVAVSEDADREKDPAGALA